MAAEAILRMAAEATTFSYFIQIAMIRRPGREAFLVVDGVYAEGGGQLEVVLKFDEWCSESAQAPLLDNPVSVRVGDNVTMSRSKTSQVTGGCFYWGSLTLFNPFATLRQLSFPTFRQLGFPTFQQIFRLIERESLHVTYFTTFQLSYN